VVNVNVIIRFSLSLYIRRL